MKTQTTQCLLTILLFICLKCYPHKSDTLSHTIKVDSLKSIIKSSASQDEIILNKIYLAKEYLHLKRNKLALHHLNDLTPLVLNREDDYYLGLVKSLKCEYYFFENDVKNCIRLGQESIDILEKHKYKSPFGLEIIYRSSRHVANSYKYINEYTKSVDYFLKCLNYLPSDPIKKDKKKVQIYNSLGFINCLSRNYSLSLEYLKKSLVLVSKTKLKYEEAALYNVIGTVYGKLDDFDNAMKYYNLSKSIAKQNNDTNALAYTCNNMAIDLSLNNKLIEAEELAREALKYADENELDFIKAETYLTLGRIFHLQDKINKSLVYIKKAKTLADQLNTHFISIESLIEKSIVQNKIGLYDEAIESLELAFNESKLNKINDLSEKTAFKLHEAYLEIDPQKSVHYLDVYKRIKQELKSESSDVKTAILSSEINYLKAEAELKQKESELLLAKTKENSIKQLVILSFGVFIIIIGLLTVLYLKTKKNIRLKTRVLDSHKKLTALEHQTLQQDIEYKNKQLTDFAMHITEKNELLNHIKSSVRALPLSNKCPEINSLIFYINTHINQNNDKVMLYNNVNDKNIDFGSKIHNNYPDLNDKEKKIVTLLRLNNSSKQIAGKLQISISSVDNYRSNLRKKMNVPKKTSLSNFVKSI